MAVLPDFQRGADIGAGVKNGKPSLADPGRRTRHVTLKAHRPRQEQSLASRLKRAHTRAMLKLAKSSASRLTGDDVAGFNPDANILDQIINFPEIARDLQLRPSKRLETMVDA